MLALGALGAPTLFADPKPPLGPPQAPAPTGKPRVSITSRLSHDDTTLGVDAVATKIDRVYMNGLLRCYHNALAANPAASGALRLDFAVSAIGRTTDVVVRGFSDPTRSCVAQIVGLWSFPIPKDKADKPTTARFSLVLAFDP